MRVVLVWGGYGVAGCRGDANGALHVEGAC